MYHARKFLRRNRAVAVGTAAAVAVVVSTGLTLWSLARGDAPPKPALTDKDTIVLADFENKTGDAAFDDTLRQGLEVQLQQSPFLEPHLRCSAVRSTLATDEPAGGCATDP